MSDCRFVNCCSPTGEIISPISDVLNINHERGHIVPIFTIIIVLAMLLVLILGFILSQLMALLTKEETMKVGGGRQTVTLMI